MAAGPGPMGKSANTASSYLDGRNDQKADACRSERKSLTPRTNTVMKLIDKRKDYYDYLQGVWGMDPKAVYYRMSKDVFKPGERPEFFSKRIPDGVHCYRGVIVLVCGRVVHEIEFENGKDGIVMKRFYRGSTDRPAGLPPLYVKWNIARIEKIRGYLYREKEFEGSQANPFLLSFPLTVVPAEEVFSGIQDYILSQYDVDVVDRRTDIQKLEAAGFDRRTSFRNV